ncbi:hypothetical protein QVD17_35504 [Tagetes erecta]|uniref:Uncharacterized protein n=1 Tax=Tagetes erecta TaxID=13708 RepID=A0AAD8K3K2_TARER|nr:hypothetical protein QVD17_35504 [Tagetes erecta]
MHLQMLHPRRQIRNIKRWILKSGVVLNLVQHASVHALAIAAGVKYLLECHKLAVSFLTFYRGGGDSSLNLIPWSDANTLATMPPMEFWGGVPQDWLMGWVILI